MNRNDMSREAAMIREQEIKDFNQSWEGEIACYAFPVVHSPVYKGRQVRVENDIDGEHALEQFLDFFEALIEVPGVAEIMRKYQVQFISRRPVGDRR